MIDDSAPKKVPMPPKPQVRPRPGGGFNPGMGGFGEHMDEQAMQQASQQKALSQQAAQATTGTQQGANSQLQQMMQQAGTPEGMQQLQQQMGGSGAGAAAPGATPGTGEQPPAEPTSAFDAIITQPVEAVTTVALEVTGLQKIVDYLFPDNSPEAQAKKQQTLQRLQKLDQEQQMVVQQKYQEAMQRQKQQEEERQRQEQAEKEQSKQVVMPSSPKKGGQGPGAKKPRAVQKLEDDRKSSGGAPQSAG